MIPLIKPDLDFSEVANDIECIINSGRLASGPYVQKFEQQFADYLGIKYAVTTTSATTALHMSLMALDIGPGDEVLVSDFTFPASGNAIVQTGATPVLIDCYEDRFDLNLEQARKKITPKTKGIMIVHPFGQPVSSKSIRQFMSDTGLWVVEDAACAISSRWGDVPCGVMGTAACFSFHPRKILTTGEGGMITTNDDAIYKKLTILRNHGGRQANVGFEFMDNGFNYRMSEIQASLGLAQLIRINEIVDERRRIADIYLDRIESLDLVEAPLTASLEECSFQSFVIVLSECINRQKVIVGLRDKNIESTLGTYAMHSQPAFKKYGYVPGDLPHSLKLQNQSLTLPLFKGMSEEDVCYIVDNLKGVIQQVLSKK